MTKGQEESDGRIVPEGRRKAPPTGKGRNRSRGGMATTASKQVKQLEMFRGTADSPKGDAGWKGVGQPTSNRSAVPKPRTRKRRASPAMMMIEEVADEANLREAYVQVAANKGAPGPDRQSVTEVGKHLGKLLPVLQRQLLDESYRPGDIRRVWIPKSGGGQRGLGIPNVVDRLVQQAVLQVLSPHYESTFHSSSHGFRPGRSCHTALAEAKTYLEEGYEWMVDLDLEKFFDRVNHQRLMARLEQRVSDRRLLSLIHRMLKAQVVMPNGVVVSNDEGVPQGGPLSPLLSNIVLDELDQELAQRGHRFVRYADDANVYVRGERSAKRVMASITDFIERRMRLKVNRDKSAVARSGSRHFLGFRFRRDPETGEVEVLLSERSKSRLRQRIRELTPRNWGGKLTACIARVNAYLLGWIGSFRICSAAERSTFSSTDAHLRRRLRAIKLRQWKRKRTAAIRLIRMGVKPRSAWGTLYRGRRSWWRLSHSSPVEKGLSNAWFAEQGLASLAGLWSVKRTRLVIAPVQLELGLG